MTKQKRLDMVTEIVRGLLSSGHYTDHVSAHDPRPGYRMVKLSEDLEEQTKHFGSQIAFAVIQGIEIVNQIEWCLKKQQ